MDVSTLLFLQRGFECQASGVGFFCTVLSWTLISERTNEMALDKS